MWYNFPYRIHFISAVEITKFFCNLTLCLWHVYIILNARLSNYREIMQVLAFFQEDNNFSSSYKGHYISCPCLQNLKSGFVPLIGLVSDVLFFSLYPCAWLAINTCGKYSWFMITKPVTVPAVGRVPSALMRITCLTKSWITKIYGKKMNNQCWIVNAWIIPPKKIKFIMVWKQYCGER